MPASHTPAVPEGDQVRLLLAKWRQSLELHARYATLSDEHYQHVQPWPKHERPARWIIDVARQKAAALARLVDKRRAEGDRVFLEALELMAFLANLAGLQGLERYIPLASVENERRDVLTMRARRIEEPTQEMPRPPAMPARKAADPKSVTMRIASGKRSAQTITEALVIDDAVRLLGWGQKWHALDALIARLAERPPAAEVRRILREHRSRIERKAAAAVAASR
jgi:hypothetical protein